jgi:hypothetical protein
VAHGFVRRVLPCPPETRCWAPPQPRGAVLHRQPATPGQPALAQDRPGRGLVATRTGGPVDSRQPLPRTPQLARRPIAAPLPRAPPWRHRLAVAVVRQRLPVRVTLALAVGALLVRDVTQRHRWRPGQPGLGTPRAGQRLRHGGRSVVAARRPEPRQGHRRAPARREPGGQGGAVCRAGAKPADGCGASLGGTATSWASAPIAIPAACRVPAARCGGREDGTRGVCRLRWARALSTRERVGGRPQARERRDGSTLPHGIRTLPVPTDVAAGSRDEPHTRAPSTNASPASHAPLPAGGVSRTRGPRSFPLPGRRAA